MLGASPSQPLIHTNTYDPSGAGNISTVAVSRHNSNTRTKVMVNHQRRLATACTAILLILLDYWHQLAGRAGQLAIHAVVVSLGSGTATGAGGNNHCRYNRSSLFVVMSVPSSSNHNYFILSSRFYTSRTLFNTPTHLFSNPLPPPSDADSKQMIRVHLEIATHRCSFSLLL